MSRESHLELKVGSFVLVALLVLSFFIASVSDFSFMEKGSNVEAVFNFANGLKEASPVRLAGVDAGIVKKMSVYVDEADANKTKVKVRLWVQKGVRIPVDSKVTINQLGLLGEKYVEIVPGISNELVNEKTVMMGKDPVPMEKVTEQVSALADKFEVAMDKLNNGFLTQKNQESIEGALASVNEILSSIKQGNGTLGKILMDEGIYRNLEELTQDLKVNPWKLLYRPRFKKTTDAI